MRRLGHCQNCKLERAFVYDDSKEQKLLSVLRPRFVCLACGNRQTSIARTSDGESLSGSGSSEKIIAYGIGKHTEGDIVCDTHREFQLKKERDDAQEMLKIIAMDLYETKLTLSTYTDKQQGGYHQSLCEANKNILYLKEVVTMAAEALYNHTGCCPATQDQDISHTCEGCNGHLSKEEIIGCWEKWLYGRKSVRLHGMEKQDA